MALINYNLNEHSFASGLTAVNITATNTISAVKYRGDGTQLVITNNVATLSANWQNTYTGFSQQSANNASVYSTVNSNSATTWNYQGTDLKNLSAGWVGGNSAYSTVNSNSATTWNYQGTDLKALSANWQNTYTTTNANSANWILNGGNTTNAVLSVGNVSANSLYLLANNRPHVTILSSGNVSIGLGNAISSDQLTISATSASTVGQTIKASPSQTANLQQWQNSAGTTIASVSADGAITTTKLLSSANIVYDGTSNSQQWNGKSSLLLFDQFVSGTNSDGQIGSLGWRLGGSSGGSGGYQACTSSGPIGLYRITTGTTAGFLEKLSLAPGGVVPIPCSSTAGPTGTTNWVFEFTAALNRTTTIEAYIGFSNDAGTTTYNPSRAAGFRYSTLSGDTSWQAFATESSVTTTTSLTSSPDTNQHLFRIRSTAVGTYLFSIDNGTEVSISTNLPGSLVGSGVAPHFTVFTQSTAAAFLNIDKFFAHLP